MFDIRTTIIGAVAIAVVSALLGWTANGWRLNAKIDRIQAEYAVDLAKANADALAKYTALEKKKQEAIDEARKQAQTNARAADAARAELDRLRSQLASSSVSTATCASVRSYTTTLQAIFGECAARLEWLAKEADGHALDSRTLEGAWPK